MPDEKYVPPLGEGQRVRLLVEYCDVKPGTLGTITWTHPWPDMPYRVKWDGFEDVDSGFGMDDIGWLTKPEEIEAVQPAEDVFGITHGITAEQAVGLAASLIQTLDEAVPTIRRLEGVIEQKAIEEK